MESKRTYETLRMREMNLNLYILRTLKDTAHMIRVVGAYAKP